MGILGKIKGIFGRKKKEEPFLEETRLEPLGPPSITREGLPTLREPLPPPRGSLAPSLEPLPPPPRLTSETERIETSNLRAKLDLLLTQMDSVKAQNQMINERLKVIEKTLAEMRGIRYY